MQYQSKSQHNSVDRNWQTVLYSNNEKSEREIKESIPFTTATKTIKYLGINLTKETKYLGINLTKETFSVHRKL